MSSCLGLLAPDWPSCQAELPLITPHSRLAAADLTQRYLRAPGTLPKCALCRSVADALDFADIQSETQALSTDSSYASSAACGFADCEPCC